MGRVKQPEYFYAVLNTPYLSKEEMIGYRPEKVVIVLNSHDVCQIKKYMEYTITKDGSKENTNSEGFGITVKYPIEVELITFTDPEETMFDDDCAFDASAAGIYIHGGYMYFKTADYNDNWDIAEGEFNLTDLKPMSEWVLEKELNKLED